MNGIEITLLVTIIFSLGAIAGGKVSSDAKGTGEATGAVLLIMAALISFGVLLADGDRPAKPSLPAKELPITEVQP